MSYHHTDPARESEPHALPDVEVFHSDAYFTPDDPNWKASGMTDSGWYWAAGFPGCLWDSDPVGPFDTEAAALEDARS